MEPRNEQTNTNEAVLADGTAFNPMLPPVQASGGSWKSYLVVAGLVIVLAVAFLCAVHFWR